MLPSFIGVGAQRAATTWVYQCLKEHPEIFMPDVKEIHFFDENYDKKIEWYQDFFKMAKSYKAVGEITPNYLNVPDAIPRIAKHIPNAYIFVIFREPISRAYSAYKLLHEKFGHLSFREACEKTDYFLKLSLYANDLKRIYDFFPERQVKVFFYEDVKAYPDEMLRELFHFIGVDAAFQPKAASQIYNAIIMPGVQNFARNIKMGWLVEFSKKNALGKWAKSRIVRWQGEKRLRAAQSGAGAHDDSSWESKEYITHLKDYFRDDILELQKMTKRDLSSWL